MIFLQLNMQPSEVKQDTSQQLSRLVQAYIRQQRQKQKGVQQVESILSQLNGQIYYECIGMLKVQWRNKQTKQLEFIVYGTAFGVAPHIIITCAHNIYNEDERIVSDEIIFVPNHHGYIEPNITTYYSIKKNFYQFISLQAEQTFREVPTINQLCLIALSQPIRSKKFIPIGSFQPKPNQYVEIIGFPSKGYAKINNLLSVNLNRSHLKGRIVSIQQDYIINHNLLTKTGHSGSPILYKAANNKLVAIGIHTHRGNVHENRGLFFNEKVINLIKRFEEQLIRCFYFVDKIKYIPKEYTQADIYDEIFIKVYSKADDFQQALNQYFNGSRIVQKQKDLIDKLQNGQYVIFKE